MAIEKRSNYVHAQTVPCINFVLVRAGDWAHAFVLSGQNVWTVRRAVHQKLKIVLLLTAPFIHTGQGTILPGKAKATQNGKKGSGYLPRINRSKFMAYARAFLRWKIQKG